MNVQVLVVDDMPAKVDVIRKTLAAVQLTQDVKVDHAGSVVDAVRHMEQSTYDLLVLDMVLPLRTGEALIADGGMRLLDEFDMSSNVRRPQHVIGLTAFQDVRLAKMEALAALGWLLLHYDVDNNEWARVLVRYIIHIAETKGRGGTPKFGVDLAVVTALQRPELEAVLRLHAGWGVEQREGDDTVYHRGRFEGPSGKLTVVAWTALDVGMPAAAALATKVSLVYRPKYLVMTGIAAGVRGSFGDVLVADQVWDYGSGKSRWRPRFGIRMLSGFGRVEFQPAPVSISISQFMKARLQLFSMGLEGRLASIRGRWQGTQCPAEKLTWQLGAMASGAAVLEDAPRIMEIRRQNRKLVGIEMEVFGVYMAARVVPEPKPEVLAIKSICDFGDHHKSDVWQDYAAFTSAEFLYEFALDQFTEQQFSTDRAGMAIGRSASVQGE